MMTVLCCTEFWFKVIDLCIKVGIRNQVQFIFCRVYLNKSHQRRLTRVKKRGERDAGRERESEYGRDCGSFCVAWSIFFCMSASACVCMYFWIVRYLNFFFVSVILFRSVERERESDEKKSLVGLRYSAYSW